LDIDQAIELSRGAVMLVLVLSLPIMLVAMVVGLLISIAQAVTQLQDQTLSFVPKIVAMFLTAIYLFPWALQRAIDYSTTLFHNIPGGGY
jgi:flagellar biosynthetic protein FliQ